MQFVLYMGRQEQKLNIEGWIWRVPWFKMYQWTISAVSHRKMRRNLDNLRRNFKHYIADFAIQIATDFSLYCGLIINIFEIIFTNLSRNNVYMYISNQKISRVPSSERVHWFYLHVHVCARHTCNFIFQQSVRILSAMPKVLCACNVFLLMNYNVTKGEIPEMENMQQDAHVYFFLLLSLGVGAIEPPPIHNIHVVPCSVHIHVCCHTITTAVLKGTLETLLT